MWWSRRKYEQHEHHFSMTACALNVAHSHSIVYKVISLVGLYALLRVNTFASFRLFHAKFKTLFIRQCMECHQPPLSTSRSSFVACVNDKNIQKKSWSGRRFAPLFVLLLLLLTIKWWIIFVWVVKSGRYYFIHICRLATTHARMCLSSCCFSVDRSTDAVRSLHEKITTL